MLCGMKATDEKMASLTQEDILDRINNKNVSQIFLKEKNFKAIIILLHSTRIVPWSCTVYGLEIHCSKLSFNLRFWGDVTNCTVLSKKDDIKSYFHTLLYCAYPDELIPLVKIRPISEHRNLITFFIMS